MHALQKQQDDYVYFFYLITLSYRTLHYTKNLYESMALKEEEKSGENRSKFCITSHLFLCFILEGKDVP